MVTTSFHGTAFSLNFEKPFFSVLSDKTKEDTRMLDLLDAVGAKERALVYNTPIIDTTFNMDYSIVTPKVEAIRKESQNYLNMILKDCSDNSDN